MSALALCCFATFAQAQTSEEHPGGMNTYYRVTIKNGKGVEVGYARFTPLLHGTQVDFNLHGMPPGQHAVHIHEKGSCVGPDFTSAGGHFSPKHAMHGYDNAKGPHEGDLANIFVSADGKAEAQMIAHDLVAKKGTGIFQKGGTSIVIHDQADDEKSQPSGAAGNRIACGVIELK